MKSLNLPAYAPKLKKADGRVYIFDQVRKKYLVLQPEEWVRQHLLNMLVNHLGFPKALIRTEAGLKYNTLSRRSDVLIYNSITSKPLLLAECKAPEVALSEAALQQVAAYNQRLNAPALLLTNGLQLICYARIEQVWQVLDSIPTYSSLQNLIK